MLWTTRLRIIWVLGFSRVMKPWLTISGIMTEGRLSLPTYQYLTWRHSTTNELPVTIFQATLEARGHKMYNIFYFFSVIWFLELSCHLQREKLPDFNALSFLMSQVHTTRKYHSPPKNLWVLWFSPLLKNQHFPIPIPAWKVSPISARALNTFKNKREEM